MSKNNKIKVSCINCKKLFEINKSSYREYVKRNKNENYLCLSCKNIINGFKKRTKPDKIKDSLIMHKKTLWDHAKKMGMKESEFAKKYQYTKIIGLEK